MNKAVLFDADGVLVDACDIHFCAFQKALAEYGVELSHEEHQERLNGRPTAVKLQMIGEEHHLSPTQQTAIERRKQEITRDLLFTELRVDPTKVKLLADLVAANYTIGVASNSLRFSLGIMLDRTGLISLVDAYIGNDEAPPKPAPDLYLELAKRLDVAIENCVIVEDSEVGITAAIAAKPRAVLCVSGPKQVNVSLLPRIQESFDSE